MDISKVEKPKVEKQTPKVNIIPVDPTVKPTDSEFECFGCGS
jgi:hypothetical protein